MLSVLWITLFSGANYTSNAGCQLKTIYQQCGPLCPQTCDNIGTSNCQGGCAEGCFCPDGQLMSNRRCIDPIACEG